MDKYLQEILKAYLSVILPEFGALTVEENSHKVVFNPYVTYNDGKFQNFLVEKHGMDAQEASNMVAQYVKEIQNHVNKGESFVIFQFGRFLKLNDGAVDFQNWEDFNPKGTQKSKGSELDKSAETFVEELKEVGPEATTIVELPQVEKNETVKKSDKKEVKKDPAKKAEKPKKTPKLPKEKKEKKKRGTFFYVNIVLLFIVLIGAGLVGVYYDQVQSFLGLTKTEKKKPSAVQEEFAEIAKAQEQSADLVENTDSDTAISQTETANETTATEQVTAEQKVPVQSKEKVKEETPNVTSVPSTISGTYHLIGGSFGDPANAERFAQTLQGKGLPAQVLNKTGKLTLVSVQSFSTLEEAKSAASSVSEQSGTKVWIYKQK